MCCCLRYKTNVLGTFTHQYTQNHEWVNASQNLKGTNKLLHQYNINIHNCVYLHHKRKTSRNFVNRISVLPKCMRLLFFLQLPSPKAGNNLGWRSFPEHQSTQFRAIVKCTNKRRTAQGNIHKGIDEDTPKMSFTTEVNQVQLKIWEFDSVFPVKATRGQQVSLTKSKPWGSFDLSYHRYRRKRWLLQIKHRAHRQCLPMVNEVNRLIKYN